jgi:CDP-diacylglycerol--glycerol-3-phosphate 3-phosphatidyltransferase
MIPVFLAALLSGLIPEAAAGYTAAGIFVLAALTDTLDGYIARSCHMITTFGKFMDPLADKLLVCAALAAFIELGRLPAWVVVIIISREFIITGFRTLAAEKGIVLAAGFSGKLKTVFQMLMITALLLNFQNGIYQAVCFALVVISVALTVYSGVEYIAKNAGVLKG